MARANTVFQFFQGDFENARAFPNHTDILLVLLDVSELCLWLDSDTSIVSYRPFLEPSINSAATAFFTTLQPSSENSIKPSRYLPVNIRALQQNTFVDFGIRIILCLATLGSSPHFTEHNLNNRMKTLYPSHCGVSNSFLATKVPHSISLGQGCTFLHQTLLFPMQIAIL